MAYNYQIEDIVKAVSSAVSLCPSETEPQMTYPFMLWMDTATATLKIRSGDNTGWELMNSAIASAISFDDTVAQLSADNVQTAIEKLKALLDAQAAKIVQAASVTFDDTIAQLGVSDVQAAIEKLKQQDEHCLKDNVAGQQLLTAFASPYAVIADAASPVIDLTTRNRFKWTLSADREFPLLAPAVEGEWHFNVYPGANSLSLASGWAGKTVGSLKAGAVMHRLAAINDGTGVYLIIDNLGV